MSVSERREASSRSGRQAARDGGSRLPCLNSDNCSKPKKDGWYEGLGTDAGLDGFIRQNGIELSAYHKKAIFALRLNLEAHINECSVERIGFMTVSFKEKVFEYKQATKHFHSLVSSSAFLEMFGRWYRVAEQHRDGSWHLHLLVECKDDIRTGFDWDEWSASKSTFRTNRGVSYSHLAKCCPKDHPIRVYWQGMVKMSERSKMIGRCQMEPVKGNSEGCGKYLSKYMDKGFITNRKTAKEKGTHVERRRLVGKGGNAIRAASSRLSWVSPGGRRWRSCVGEVAEHFGIKDVGEFSANWGPRWAYRIKDLISYLPYTDADGMRTMRLPMELEVEDFGGRVIGIPRFTEDRVRRFVFGKLNEIRIRKDLNYEKKQKMDGGEATFSFKEKQCGWSRDL